MDTPTIDETTWRYLGQWQRLVSTTNWDKGRIIVAWRKNMEEQGAAAADFTDEAWARQVGNVTAQHVGRLRRTWERFASVADDYPGLYWSHFQAAGDWHDAEMWLEGAVQNNWSVLEMRRQRATTLGTIDAEATVADTGVPWDDDAPADDVPGLPAERAAVVHDPAEAQAQRAGHGSASAEEDAWSDGEESEPAHGDGAWADADGHEPARSAAAAEPRQPFAALPSLPADVSDAFEAFKLCILRHKLAGWSEISASDILAALDALKELALAPASE